MHDPFGLDFRSFSAIARDMGLPAAGMLPVIYRTLMRGDRIEATGISPRSCAAWNAAFTPGFLEPVRIEAEPSAAGTVRKVCWRCGDGAEIESVLIPMAVREGSRPRNTLCISSQVGCRMACAYCLTGTMGLARNLASSEIVAQERTASLKLGWDVHNIVFMGMGEPLDNLAGLAGALDVFTDQIGLHIAGERITVCTSGIPEGIARLRAMASDIPGRKRMGLSVSLFTGDPVLRKAVMPGASAAAGPRELAAAASAYPARANFMLGVNICLMAGVNDRREDIESVAAFCAEAGRTMVNVIPWNPPPDGTCRISGGRAPTPEETERYIEGLRAAGCNVRGRIPKGTGIMAGCGQLASEGRALKR